MSIADVIINNSTNELDRAFSYLIPKHLKDLVQVGSRVLVPFGKNNSKVEAYVIEIHDKHNDFKMKNIYEILDSSPVINRNMIEIARLMKYRYMCSFLDCIKCMIPSGITIKTDKILTLISESSYPNIKSETQKRIISLLSDSNNEIKYNELKIAINDNKKLNTSIKSLLEKGLLKIEYKLSTGIQDKMIKVAYLSSPKEDVQVIIDSLPQNYNAQKRILELMLDNDYMPVNELIKFANASHTSLNSLIKKGVIEVDEIKVDRDPYYDLNTKSSEPLELSEQQKNALNQIVYSIQGNLNQKFLLHGVTGSGKTEVYLQAIDNVILNGGNSIVLVPEISLTPQMIRIFKARFGDKVAVQHSRLSQGERYDQWHKIKNGEVSVVVGARSAIFAPFNNLKLIIVDEEHENTYKSESKPKYHVKEIADLRRQIEGCTIVLGSATPSVNTYYESTLGNYNILEMNNRVNECILPKVAIIDMREELEEGNRSIFSKTLSNEISKNLENGQQTILFLNRRGHSTFVSCRKCGNAIVCPNCNITLTYHMFTDMLSCHYCGFEMRNPSTCPTCDSKYIKYFGVGTQKIEQEVRKLFSNASVLRMDVDTTGTKFSHQKILDRFEKENINILIGTQMIAKGLDYPNVTLVGVISADTSLNLDDFRAGERTFQLLTQVAGRAGRGEKQGRVVIQTYQPENYSIITAGNHDYKNFYENEIISRENMDYPPFVDLISVLISHEDNEASKKYTLDCEKNINKYLKTTSFKYTIFNSTPAPINKIKQMHRWRILIKIERQSDVYDFFKKLQVYYSDKVNINIDINSNNML